jgi:hypothetical protein
VNEGQQDVDERGGGEQSVDEPKTVPSHQLL